MLYRSFQSFLLALLFSGVLVAPCNAETRSETALRSLYNALVRDGAISGPALSSELFWKKIRVKEYAKALDQISPIEKPKGGIIYNEKFSADAAVTVSGSFEKGYYAKIAGESGEYLLDSHPRDTSCELVKEPRTSLQLTSRLRCLSLRAFRREIENGLTQDAGFDKLVEASGLRSILERELNSAVANQVIEGFTFPATGTLPVRVSVAGHDRELLLNIDRFNPFATPQAEAADLLARIYSAVSQGSFIFLSAEDPQSFQAEEIRAALQAIGESESPEKRQEEFLKFESEPKPMTPPVSSTTPISQIPRSPTCSETIDYNYPNPDSEPIETVTPGNNEVAIIVGPRSEFLDSGTSKMVDLLRAAGYKTSRYNLGFGINQQWISSCDLRRAETLVVQAHGQQFFGSCGASSESYLGQFFASGRPLSCRAPLLRLASAFGVVREEDIICEGSLNSPEGMFCSVTVPGSGFTFISRYHGDLAFQCEVGVLPSGGPAGDGRVRALQLTEQCYGGMQGGDRSFLDNVTGPVTQWTDLTVGHDWELLRADLSGDSQYCAASENPGLEPFRGGACGQEDSVIIGPIGYFAAQGSAQERGNIHGGEERRRYPERFNAAGLKQYWALRDSGHPYVQVELAPRATVYRYRPEYQGYAFLDLAFTSTIDLPTLDVSIDDTHCPTPDAIAQADRATLYPSEHGVSMHLNPAYPLLPVNEWGDEETLYSLFHKRQSDWRNYLEVKIKAKAPNRVPLVGNGFQGSTEPWVFPFNVAPGVAPWAHFNGKIPYKGFSQVSNDTFTVRLPCTPALTCITPHLECDNGGVIQNGENVSAATYANCSVSKTCFLRDGTSRTHSQIGRIIEDALPCDGLEDHCPTTLFQDLIPNPVCPDDEGKIRTRTHENYSSIPFSGGYESALPILGHVHCGDS